MRFGAAVGGVAFVVALILMIQALYAGYRDSATSFVDDVPVDVWVGQAGAFDLFRSTSVLPASTAQDVAETPGVASVGELRGRQARFSAGDDEVATLVISFSPNLDQALSEVLGLEQLPAAGEIAISEFIHQAIGISTGDRMAIGDTVLTVSAVLKVKSPPFGTFSVINYEDANAMFSMGGTASFLLVAAEDPAAIDQLIANIEAGVSNVRAYGRDDFSANNSITVTGFLPVIEVILAVTYLVGTVITGLTIYTATVEKTRDYGVLKAIGARNSYVYGIVIYQSLAVSILGFVIGVPLALAASLAAEDRVPEFVTAFEWTSALITFVAVMIMGFIASVLPVRRITAIDPAMVFRA